MGVEVPKAEAIVARVLRDQKLTAAGYSIRRYATATPRLKRCTGWHSSAVIIKGRPSLGE
jgi:hypothetical protein